MKIEVIVSVGELLDKISILRVKLKNIKDANKLEEVKKELEVLTTRAISHSVYNEEFVSRLEKINGELWRIEDRIRILEKQQLFGLEFVEVARSVYVTNDERFNIKNEINEHYGSFIREQKDYEDYTNG
tara:strand:+ start:5625 stop:6011 length:387 start_codon:yes stop_codon:yes gene_type:complete